MNDEKIDGRGRMEIQIFRTGRWSYQRRKGLHQMLHLKGKSVVHYLRLREGELIFDRPEYRVNVGCL